MPKKICSIKTGKKTKDTELFNERAKVYIANAFIPQADVIESWEPKTCEGLGVL